MIAVRMGCGAGGWRDSVRDPPRSDRVVPSSPCLALTALAEPRVFRSSTLQPTKVRRRRVRTLATTASVRATPSTGTSTAMTMM